MNCAGSWVGKPPLTWLGSSITGYNDRIFRSRHRSYSFGRHMIVPKSRVIHPLTRDGVDSVSSAPANAVT